MTFRGTTPCGFTYRCLPAVACLAVTVAFFFFFTSPASAQTANKATLRSWNITGATGSTANVLAVVTDTAGSNVWIASETPQVRIGVLNPTTDQYQEWRPSIAQPPRSLALNTLAAASGGGELWFTYGGGVGRKLPGTTTPNFRTFNLGINGETHGVAIAANGDAIVASYNGTDRGVWRIPRAATGASVSAQFWAATNANDFPHDVKVDGAGFVWFTNRNSAPSGSGPDKVARLDLSNGNLIEWTLPYGTGVTGLNVTNNTTAPFAAKSVCVLTGGTATPEYLDGEALCFDVPAVLPASISVKRIAGSGYNYPQQVAFTNAGDVFLTEQMASAVSYATAAAVSASAVSPVPASTRTLTVANRSVAATDASVSPQAAITISGANRVDANVTGTPDGTGRVRFLLPNALEYPHPVGLSAVIGLPGVTYVAEYFRGYGDAIAGRVTRFTLNPPAPPVILLNGTKAPVVPTLSFTSTIGGAAPASQDIAVEEETSLPVSWTATSNQPWLTAVAVNNDAVTPSTLRVSVTPPTSAGTYTGTITVEGADGATTRTIDVTLSVAAQPTILVTGSTLTPEPGYVGKLVFTAVAGFDLLPTPILPTPHTLMISNTGGGTLAWTTAVTADAGNTVSGNTLTLTPSSGSQAADAGASAMLVSITPGNVPGTLGVYRGVLTISSTNATNTQQVRIELNVVEHGAPTLTLPAPVTAEAENGSGAHVTFVVTATDVLGNAITPTCTLGTGRPVVASGALFPLGSTTVACEANDGLGSRTTGSFTIAVVDTTGPVFTGVANKIAEATGPNPNAATVTYALPTATDAVDGSRPVACAPPSGSSFTLGDTLVTCTASDAAGHQSTASFTVKVQDTTPPVLSGVPANIANVEATGPAGAAVSFSLPTATDLVDGALPVTCAPASNSTFALGATTVTCTATDLSGRDARSTFTVTVVDSTAPVLTLPTITVSATGPTGANVSYTGATAADVVSGSRPLTCTPASGSLFSIGTSTVTCSATDAAGNTAQGSFSVTVQGDAVPPVLTLPSSDVTAEATSLAPGTIVTYAASASDPDHGSIAIACSPASGSPFPVGTSPVQCSATDGFGNSTSGSFNVVVRDTTPPVLTLSNITATATSASGASVTYSGSATDLGQSVPVTCGGQPVPVTATLPIGTTTVSCSATDGRGNTTTGSFTVTVNSALQLGLAPVQLSFTGNRWTTCNGSTQGSSPAAQSLSLTNTTGSTLWYQAVIATNTGTWLTGTPLSSSVLAGASRTVSFSADSQGLAQGTYTGTITVYTLPSATADPYGPNINAQVIPVTLTVNPAAPRLCVTPTSLSFGTLLQNSMSPAKFITITNAGDGTLPAITWTTPRTTNGRLDVATTAGGLRVHVFTTTAKGSQSGSFTIKAGTQSQAISATWSVGSSKGSGHHHDDSDDGQCHGDHDGDGDHDSNDHNRHRSGIDRD